MSSVQITAAGIAIGFATILLILLRRDHIYIKQVVFWVAVTSAVLFFGFMPGVVDQIGHKLGISYPPIILALVAILVLLVKALLADLALTKVERRLRRLSQRLALLEGEQPEFPSPTSCDQVDDAPI